MKYILILAFLLTGFVGTAQDYVINGNAIVGGNVETMTEEATAADSLKNSFKFLLPAEFWGTGLDTADVTIQQILVDTTGKSYLLMRFETTDSFKFHSGGTLYAPKIGVNKDDPVSENLHVVGNVRLEGTLKTKSATTTSTIDDIDSDVLYQSNTTGNDDVYITTDNGGGLGSYLYLNQGAAGAGEFEMATSNTGGTLQRGVSFYPGNDFMYVFYEKTAGSFTSLRVCPDSLDFLVANTLITTMTSSLIKLHENLSLAVGSQDYIFSDRGNALVLQAQNSNSPGQLEFYTNDGDGSDNLNLEFWGVGTPSSVTNRERLRVGYIASNLQYEISTEADGSGTLRPLILYTEGNTNQLSMDISGNVGIGTATFGTNAAGTFAIKAGTAPTTQPADISQMWVEDFNGIATATIHTKTEDNKISVLTPIYGEVYMQGNATVTTISTINTPVLVSGTTTAGLTSHATSSVAGRVTYDGEETLVFTCLATMSKEPAAGVKTFTFYLAKNGIVETKSSISMIDVGVADRRAISIHALISLASGDYIEVWAENNTDATDITIVDMNLTITKN